MKRLSSFFNVLLLLIGSPFLTASAQEPFVGLPDQREWSVVATYVIPGKASGLAFDGTYLYSGIYGVDGNQVYRIDPGDGSYILEFSSSQLEDAYGLTWDGSYLWTIVQPTSSNDDALATKLDMDGNFLEQIPLPDHYMSGIAAGEGNFWVATYYPNPGKIYLVDAAGNVLDEFQSPGQQPWDLCLEGQHIWVADYDANLIYRIDRSGNILESQPSVSIKPAGIVWDGQYLWYVDGQLGSNSTLYKVDLGGAGTPAIYLPESYHDFGTVTIGDSAVWNMTVQNLGTADLTLEGLQIQNAVPVFCWQGFPVVIGPGGTVSIGIIFKPQEPLPLNTVMSILSDDPVNPGIDVQLIGEGVYSGPSLFLSEEFHDYGTVRLNAYTRWYLKVVNIGDAPLVLEGISLDEPHFLVESSVQFPIGILPLDSARIGIWFHPEEAVVYEGILTLSSNDPLHDPAQIDLKGEGADIQYEMGDLIWQYSINTSYDNSPKAMSPVQDITGDGINDVIVCSEDNYVRCFNGNSSTIADVLWETQVYSGNIYRQQSLVVSQDLNNDQFWDVIIGSTGGDRSIIALSGKTGEIIWKHDTHEYGEGGWIYQVDCSFDYNGDDIPDILAATGDDSNDTGPKRIYCLDALTGESIWECAAGGPVFSAIGIADFTGDGQPDAAAGASDEGELIGRVYGIDGADGSIEWTFYTEGSSVWGLGQTDDSNGDLIPDLIAGDFSGHVYILDASYGSQIGYSFIGPYLILECEGLNDLNGDMHRDFSIGNSGSNALVVSGMDASTVWLTPVADKPWNTARIDDITGDGINDLIVGTLYSSNYCYFMNGTNGDPVFMNGTGTPVDALVAIQDITGDGSMEVLVGGRNGMVYCYSGGSDSSVGEQESPFVQDQIFVTARPNPFGELTQITLTLAQAGYCRVTIHDVNGRLISSLTEGYLTSGQHQFVWNGPERGNSNNITGMYFLRIYAGDECLYYKLIHI